MQAYSGNRLQYKNMHADFFVRVAPTEVLDFIHSERKLGFNRTFVLEEGIRQQWLDSSAPKASSCHTITDVLSPSRRVSSFFPPLAKTLFQCTFKPNPLSTGKSFPSLTEQPLFDERLRMPENDAKQITIDSQNTSRPNVSWGYCFYSTKFLFKYLPSASAYMHIIPCPYQGSLLQCGTL